ncbi:hypothetical protein D3C81_2004720 [compost metagenome]
MGFHHCIDIFIDRRQRERRKLGPDLLIDIAYTDMAVLIHQRYNRKSLGRDFDIVLFEQFHILLQMHTFFVLIVS